MNRENKQIEQAAGCALTPVGVVAAAAAAAIAVIVALACTR